MKEIFFSKLIGASMRRWVMVLVVLYSCSTNGYSQDQDSIILKKGRFITSLNGTISNENVSGDNFDEITRTGYQIGTKSGYFFLDNWAIGANFSLSKEDFENEILASDYEEFSIGPWTRYYIGKRGAESGVVFAELTPYYVSIFQRNVVDLGVDGISIEEVTGNGFGIEPGFGFAYLINKNVGFGLAVSYRFSELDIETKNLTFDTIDSNNLNINELIFSFEFQIYLNEFFF